MKQSGLGLRAAGRLYGVNRETLRRHVAGPIQKNGRPTALTTAEEALLRDALLEFADNGTPLSRQSVQDVVAHFVNRLSPDRQNSLPFREGRPSKHFVSNFLKRHPELKLRRRAAMERSRADAMSPTNLAMHYARLIKVYQEFNITSAAQVFNLDESGFSTRTAGRGRVKAVMRGKGRNNSIDLDWSRNAEHITLMPVVSADGRAWTPVAILPGVRTKFRERPDGTRETPASFLPPSAYVCYRDPAGMDSSIFYQWASRFVRETADLRKQHNHLVLTLDGFTGHTCLKALQLLRDNGIVVIALPAHTSHRTQSLDYSVFSPFKAKLTNHLNNRTVYSAMHCARNDVYTLCELIHEAYKEAVTYKNIVNGFRACGVWCEQRKSANPDVIRESDITNVGSAPDRASAFASFKELVSSYRRSCRILRSDGAVAASGSLNTTGGALLTADEVLHALKERASQREQEAEQRAARAARAAEQRLQREREAAQRDQQREEERARLHAHVIWLAQRGSRQGQLNCSRLHRRRLRREAAAKASGTPANSS